MSDPGARIPEGLAAEVITLLRQVAIDPEDKWMVGVFLRRFGREEPDSVGRAYGDLLVAMKASPSVQALADAVAQGLHDLRQSDVNRPSVEEVDAVFAKHDAPYRFRPPNAVPIGRGVGGERVLAPTLGPSPRSSYVAGMASPVKLFISHNEDVEDRAFVFAICHLIVGAMDIPDDAIRCTSHTRHQPPIGVDVKPLLLDELRSAPACIGVITPKARESAWVIAELGARWGLGKHFAPVLHPHAGFEVLPKPFNGHFSAEASNRDKMLNLLDQVSEKTGCPLRKLVRVNESISEFLAAMKTLPKPSDSTEAPQAKAELNRGAVEACIRSMAKGGDVLAHLDALKRAGAHSSVLETALDEQERQVRHLMSEVRRTYVLGQGAEAYCRKWLEPMKRLIAEFIEFDLESSKPVLHEFGVRLARKRERKGPDYESEFQEQTYLLADEIDAAYGASCLPFVVSMGNDAFALDSTPMCELLLKHSSTGDTAARPKRAPQSRRVEVIREGVVCCYLEYCRWVKALTGDGLELWADVYSDASGDGRVQGLGDAESRIGYVYADKGVWRWVAYQIPTRDVLDKGPAQSKDDAKQLTISTLASAVPGIAPIIWPHEYHHGKRVVGRRVYPA